MLSTFGGRLAAITAVALVVRIAYTLSVGADIPTIGDAETYHLLADNLADGHGYIRPHELSATGEEIPTAEFPPLFPGLLAAADFLGAGSILQQKLVMGGVGAGTVGLIGVLGRSLAGPAVGLVAAAIAALYPMLFGIDGALMAETPYLALLTGSLVLGWRARMRPTRGRWFALGATVGAAALTRSEAVFLVVLLAAPLAAGIRSLPSAARAARFAFALAGVAVLVVPWTVRNAIALDHLVPLSNNLGGLVVGANCPQTYTGELKGLWLFACYERADVTGLDETERSRAFRDAGIEYARDHRGDVPGVLAVRLLRTWGLYDPDGQIAWETLEGRDRGWQTAGHRTYLALLPLAIAGAVVACRLRLWQWPLLVTPVVVCAVTVVAYGNQRFRATAEPAIAVFAAVAIVAAVEWVRRRQPSRQRRGRRTTANKTNVLRST